MKFCFLQIKVTSLPEEVWLSNFIRMIPLSLIHLHYLTLQVSCKPTKSLNVDNDLFVFAYLFTISCCTRLLNGSLNVGTWSSFLIWVNYKNLCVEEF